MTHRDFRDTGVLLLIVAVGTATLAGGITGLFAAMAIAGACILIGRTS